MPSSAAATPACSARVGRNNDSQRQLDMAKAPSAERQNRRRSILERRRQGNVVVLRIAAERGAGRLLGKASGPQMAEAGLEAQAIRDRRPRKLPLEVIANHVPGRASRVAPPGADPAV